MEKLAVIIPAAGFGTRMGSKKPKPFLLLGNQPIIWHSINAFSRVKSVVQIIIPTSHEWHEHVSDICSKIPNNQIDFKIILGGKERQYSILNGLDHVQENVNYIAVHDAVRPLITPDLIVKTHEQAVLYGGAIVGVPAKDTIKKVDDFLSIKQTPERDGLWQAQTPQIFNKKLLLKAYESATKDNFIGTDDSSLVERVGGTVKVVEGNRSNLKITYPIDLNIAEMILKEKEAV